MRVLSLVKSSLNSLRKPSSSSEVPEASADLKRGSVHETPPGEFPKGPKPSACLIVTFHLSKILTLVGIILVVRALLVDKVNNSNHLHQTSNNIFFNRITNS